MIAYAMRGLSYGGLVVFGLALASALSCGGDGDATREPTLEPTLEPAVVLRGVVSRPQDMSYVEWVIRERFVRYDEFFDLSGGLTKDTLRSVNAHAVNVRPRGKFERLIENHGVLYSSAILFEHPDEAELFFDEARRLALTLDWFETHPALSGEAVDRPLVREVGISECDAGHGPGPDIEEAFWLHASGSVHDGTIHDDIMLLRDGALWAIVRVPDHFPGLEPTPQLGLEPTPLPGLEPTPQPTSKPCGFQDLIGEDVIRRMVEARGTY